MKLSFTRLSLVMALLALAWGPNPVRAAVQLFTANQGSGDNALSASALVTTGTGTVTVVLTNTLDPSAVRNAGQALSDFSFTLSNAPGTQGTLTASGQLGNITGPLTSPPPSGGSVTFVAGSPVRFIGMGPAPPGGSGTFTVSGNTILMEAIGGGQPSQMILPSVPNGGTYPNVNASIYNGQFNPFTIGPASFTLNFAGVTSNTTVTAANFSFGTGPDVTVPGVPGVVIPEPSSDFLVLSALALVGVGGLMRNRLRRTTAPA